MNHHHDNDCNDHVCTDEQAGQMTNEGILGIFPSPPTLKKSVPSPFRRNSISHHFHHCHQILHHHIIIQGPRCLNCQTSIFSFFSRIFRWPLTPAPLVDPKIHFIIISGISPISLLIQKQWDFSKLLTIDVFKRRQLQLVYSEFSENCRWGRILMENFLKDSITPQWKTWKQNVTK